MKSKKEVYTVDWLLLLEVEQDDKYIIIKLLNSDKEYEMISFSNDDKLSKNQKMSLSVIVYKFYLKIQLMKKKYLLELWNITYKNILEILQKKVTNIEYEKRIALLQQQITFINQEIMKTCKFQQAYKECYKIFKKRKSSLFSDFAKQVE